MTSRVVFELRTEAVLSLATALEIEDRAEGEGLSPFDRITCRLHRRWMHDCVASPAHVVAVAGSRWCDGCAAAATVTVDHLSCTVVVSCSRCGCHLDDGLNEQLRRVCQRSLEVSRWGHSHQYGYGELLSA
ncbi:hypothetical protein ACIA8G_09195 [Lentzea sp. NPDC051213]|uniref:hypothetical protein n=1 Tax=Lentzea sp. NPDC051213 TaxID=3364126 RepID=UPI0037A5E848